MPKEIYLFYLFLNKQYADDVVINALQDSGFVLREKVGGNLGGFKSCFFERHSPEEGKIDLSFTLSPQQETINLISLSFAMDNPYEVVEQLFSALGLLADDLDFALMDSELKNMRLQELQAMGKVGQFFLGLSPEDTKKLERSCFIPIDLDAFVENGNAVPKRMRFLGLS